MVFDNGRYLRARKGAPLEVPRKVQHQASFFAQASVLPAAGDANHLKHRPGRMDDHAAAQRVADLWWIMLAGAVRAPEFPRAVRPWRKPRKGGT